MKKTKKKMMDIDEKKGLTTVTAIQGPCNARARFAIPPDHAEGRRGSEAAMRLRSIKTHTHAKKRNQPTNQTNKQKTSRQTDKHG